MSKVAVALVRCARKKVCAYWYKKHTVKQLTFYLLCLIHAATSIPVALVSYPACIVLNAFVRSFVCSFVLWGQYGWGFGFALMCQRKPNTDRESLPTGDRFDLRKKEEEGEMRKKEEDGRRRRRGWVAIC